METLSTSPRPLDPNDKSWWAQAMAGCDLRRAEVRSVESNREFIRAWQARRAASAYLPVFRKGSAR